jgi:KaiC/GvpD/RAD55 family RecA-like ATPase
MCISSGVDGFDDLVDGGLPAGRLYVVCGPPGSGKTTFASQFVTAGAVRGERCLFLSMHETKSNIAEDMSSYEFGFDRALKSDRVTFLDAFSTDGKRFFGLPRDHQNPSNLTNRITSFMESRDIGRLVIDSTMLLQYFLDGDEDTLISFLSALKRTDATVVLIAEMTDPSSYVDEHYLAHGVVFMHNYLEAGGITRGIQVVKMQGIDVDTDIHPVSFGDEGIGVDAAATVDR